MIRRNVSTLLEILGGEAHVVISRRYVAFMFQPFLRFWHGAGCYAGAGAGDSVSTLLEILDITPTLLYA